MSDTAWVRIGDLNDLFNELIKAISRRDINHLRSNAVQEPINKLINAANYNFEKGLIKSAIHSLNLTVGFVQRALNVMSDIMPSDHSLRAILNYLIEIMNDLP